MTADDYLYAILQREQVDAGAFSPLWNVQTTIQPIIQGWAGNLLTAVTPSGSFAKGTANASGTDIDLFISLSTKTNESLKEIYNSLDTTMISKGYTSKRQNVSINVKVNGYSVDLVPAKRQDTYSDDHSLYRRKADTWTKTNVTAHINFVKLGGRINESRIVKLWRDQRALDFPSFYLELTIINALSGQFGTLADNVWNVFKYLRDKFLLARIVDPANTNNIISEDLSTTERAKIKAAAEQALKATDWNQILK
jgi:hypothetical protein